jgi:hypothetical protein
MIGATLSRWTVSSSGSAGSAVDVRRAVSIRSGLGRQADLQQCPAAAGPNTPRCRTGRAAPALAAESPLFPVSCGEVQVDLPSTRTGSA